MNEKRLWDIEGNAKWIRMDAANNGEEREYALAVDACDLIAEVRRLHALLNEIDEYAGYYSVAVQQFSITGESPMTFSEWLADANEGTV